MNGNGRHLQSHLAGRGLSFHHRISIHVLAGEYNNMPSKPRLGNWRENALMQNLFEHLKEGFLRQLKQTTFMDT